MARIAKDNTEEQKTENYGKNLKDNNCGKKAQQSFTDEEREEKLKIRETSLVVVVLFFEQRI